MPGSTYSHWSLGSSPSLGVGGLGRDSHQNVGRLESPTFTLSFIWWEKRSNERGQSREEEWREGDEHLPHLGRRHPDQHGEGGTIPGAGQEVAAETEVGAAPGRLPVRLPLRQGTGERGRDPRWRPHRRRRPGERLREELRHLHQLHQQVHRRRQQPLARGGPLQHRQADRRPLPRLRVRHGRCRFLPQFFREMGGVQSSWYSRPDSCLARLKRKLRDDRRIPLVNSVPRWDFKL